MAVNERWSLDFVTDALADGRRFRILTVVDNFTREALAVDIDFSMPARRVTAVLNQVITKRATPRMLRTDNGPEFTSRHFDHWAHANRINLDFIQPGRPMQIQTRRVVHRSHRCLEPPRRHKRDRRDAM